MTPNQRFQRIARDCRYSDPKITTVGRDVLGAYLRDEVRRHRYLLQVKRVSDIRPLSAATDPLTRTIWLPWGWMSLALEDQHELLAHELVHVRQARAMRPATFLARYLRPQWRWAIEMQAYAETIRVRHALDQEVDTTFPGVIAQHMVNYGPWWPFSEREIVAASAEVLTLAQDASAKGG